MPQCSLIIENTPTQRNIELITIPRTGEYIFTAGAFYMIKDIVHNLDKNGVIDIYVAPSSIPSSGEAKLHDSDNPPYGTL
ncbi:hypothetical protein ACT3S9_18535 [Pseudoalteromonas sp. AOP31-A2-14]|jgi:hypothetical protein|uniref:hypothetical protein n=1 Tax=Pseudoalteromonas TaxID=53246 RepID=UPI003F963AE8